MSDFKKIHSVITPEELAMLNGDLKKVPASGIDPGFKYRNMVLTLIYFLMLGRLLLFPGAVQAQLNLPQYMGDLSTYFQVRGAFAFSMAMIYFVSYIKDWNFPRIALIMATLSLASLVSDFFNIYRFISGPMTPTFVGLILGRLLLIYCLFMNSIRDNRAPPMPRHLYS